MINIDIFLKKNVYIYIYIYKSSYIEANLNHMQDSEHLKLESINI